MSAVFTDASVYTELWISFASLIRSYVAAHDLSKPAVEHTLVNEGEAGHLTLRGEGKILALTFEPATGAGSWTVYEDDLEPERRSERVLEQGGFKIGEDSQVELTDRRGKLELEVAAEAFTAKVFDEE